MGDRQSFRDDEIHEESSWRYPLGIFLATLVLCAIFLYYYVGPTVDEFSGNVPIPAISEESIEISIAGKGFSAPANYTVYPRDRRGGERDEVSLYALWPTMTGYAPARRTDFVENAPDTRRLDITIEKRTVVLSEEERIEILYLPQTLDRRGVRTPYQLTKYNFRDQRSSVPTSGYSDTELYLGQTKEGALTALFCFKEREDIPSPECWRQYEMGENISVVYRFKRPYLAEWQAIDTRVRSFIAKLDNAADDTLTSP